MGTTRSTSTSAAPATGYRVASSARALMASARHRRCRKLLPSHVQSRKRTVPDHRSSHANRYRRARIQLRFSAQIRRSRSPRPAAGDSSIHARIAILEGLSPEGEPHDSAAGLRAGFSAEEGLPGAGDRYQRRSLAAMLTTVSNAALERVDGVMIGREAYHNPYFLAELEHRLR